MRKLLFLLLLGVNTSFSQVSLDYYLPQDVSYNPDIPNPEAFLGFGVGTWHVTHDQLLSYMRLLATVSDRIEVEEMGSTYERRPTLLLRISAPENQQKIGQIKAEHHRLADADVTETMDLVSMPLVVWMGYSVHGDEASGSNAALLVAYYLAAAQSETLDQWLSETIILLDPCINPDGYNRFASWVNTHQSATLVTDPNSRQFNEAWPKGRTNHYWFDLNRDWLPVQHPSSRGRLAKFHEWKPNVLTDHHEMGSDHTFFFQPGIPSRNNPHTPENAVRLTGEMAKYHAAALDEIGSLYYTRESYDDFYYGKGSTYPDINGAVGILFEQAEVMGRARETPHGILTFPFAIRNQFTTSLSTLRGANALRMDLLEHQQEFFRSSMKLAENTPVKAWVFGEARDRARTLHFVELLRRHDVEVFRLAKSLSHEGVTYDPEHHFIVPASQPQYRLLRMVFEQPVEFRDSLFYDVSAWTLPLAFNLPFSPLEASSYSESLCGEKVSWPELPRGRVHGEPARYAYAFEWHEYYSPRLLYQLLAQGLVCKVAAKPFTNGEKAFDYGSVLIPVALQPMASDELRELLEQLAGEIGIDIYALSTGLSTSGVDLGSRSFSVIEKPRIALLVDGNVNATEAGEVWHLLDQRYQTPVSMLPVEAIAKSDLSRYNVLIMVDGNYGSISDHGVEHLRDWVSQGGTVVAQKRAIEWLALRGFAALSFKPAVPDTLTINAYEERALSRDAQKISGAIFQAELDLTHPLGFGYTRTRLPVFRNSTIFMESSNQSVVHPLNYAETPLMAGYVSGENLDKLKGTASVAVRKIGNGRIIAFTDNCNFRAFWYGTNKLFANAVFFGNTIR